MHDPYEFLNTLTSVTYDSTLANYVVKTRGLRSIAMITNNDAYGMGEHDAFKADLASLGIKPLADEVVTPDATDFSADLTTIRQKHPQVLFIGAEEVESGLIAKQARALGIKAVFAGGAPMGMLLFAGTALAANVEGSIVSSAYLSNSLNAKTRAFATAYFAAYGQAPELHGAKAYDGAQIVIRALRNSHAATGLKLANAIRAVHYAGLLGNFAFNADGVGLFTTHIGIIRNGRWCPPSSARLSVGSRRRAKSPPPGATGREEHAGIGADPGGRPGIRCDLRAGGHGVPRSSTAPWGWSTSRTATSS